MNTSTTTVTGANVSEQDIAMAIEAQAIMQRMGQEIKEFVVHFEKEETLPFDGIDIVVVFLRHERFCLCGIVIRRIAVSGWILG
jgi:hypothetical protein